MNRTDAPKKQPVPFGVNGSREDLLQTTPAGDNQASYDAGFPPVTMILKAAGGLPPKGQDMNQILYELSSIGRWLMAGAINSYDADFATAIGGYPKGAVLVSDDGSTPYISTIEANTNNPNSSTTGWVNLLKVINFGALAGGANQLPYFNGANTLSQTALSSAGRDLIGQDTKAAMLTYLGIPTTFGTAASANTGTGADDLPTTSQADTRYGLKHWSSPGSTLVTNTPLIINHGLTIDPDLCVLNIKMRCVTANNGYAVGDYCIGFAPRYASSSNSSPGAREATQEEIDGPQKTNAEKYQEELSELASNYNKDVIVLSDNFAKAALIDGVSEVVKKTEIYNEYVSRKNTYLFDISILKNKYGV